MKKEKDFWEIVDETLKKLPPATIEERLERLFKDVKRSEKSN